MSGIPVARILGFEIRIHGSWVLIVALVAVLVVRQLEVAAPGMPAGIAWLLGATIAGCFLLSVLSHELGHGIVARRRGIDVGPITLYFFGGSASFQLESDRPRDEAAVALAGPLVSLAVGGVLVGLAVVAEVAGGAAIRAAGTVALVLAVLNLILGGANLIPAYPLDGGRIVRAIVWARTGDERRGAGAAALVGRLVGWTLIAAGVAIVLTGDTVDGIMLGLSGWFLGGASRAIDRRLAVQELLADVRVGDVMERGVATVGPTLTVDTFAEQLLGDGETPAVPVVRDETVVGVIGATQLRRLARRLWATTRAEDLMVAFASLPHIGPDDTAWSALDRLRRTGLDALPVTGGEGFLGVISKRGMAATIQSLARSRGISIR